jgi:hypothetical protein
LGTEWKKVKIEIESYILEQMLKKSLNRKLYCRLLEVIGGSTVPLSKSEIMYRMRDIDPASDWRYVYEMLKDLCPTLPGTGRRYFLSI